MKSVRSYVPEEALLQDKQKETSRLFREDLALVNARDHFRVVVSRGSFFTVGRQAYARGSFDRAIEAAIVYRRRVLLPCDAGSLLLFPELLDASGLLLVLRISAPMQRVKRIFGLMERSDFVYAEETVSESLPSSAPADEDLFEMLSENLFYADRILGTVPELGIWARTSLLAHYMGCRLDHSFFPSQELPIAKDEEGRLIAFLLCTFAMLRIHEGHVGTAGSDPQADTPTYHYRVSLDSADTDSQATQKKREDLFAFLDLPVFRDFSIEMTPQGVVLEAVLPKQQRTDLTATLHSQQDVCLRIRIELLSA